MLRYGDKVRHKPQSAINDEAMNYFRTLDQYANMFMNKYEKVMKGDKYYNGIYEKVMNLVKLGNDWMIKRSQEKNAMLSSIQGKGGGPRANPSYFIDPKTNPFTNNWGKYG